jgi:hypothetical protein
MSTLLTMNDAKAQASPYGNIKYCWGVKPQEQKPGGQWPTLIGSTKADSISLAIEQCKKLPGASDHTNFQATEAGRKPAGSYFNIPSFIKACNGTTSSGKSFLLGLVREGLPGGPNSQAKKSCNGLARDQYKKTVLTDPPFFQNTKEVTEKGLLLRLPWNQPTKTVLTPSPFF